MPALTITADVRQRLIEHARARNSVKTPGSSRRRAGILSDVLGMLGEYAAATWCRSDLDWSVTLCGDNGQDLLLPDGRSVAVKYNHRAAGHLMIEDHKRDHLTHLHELRADLLILVRGSCTEALCTCDMLLAESVSDVLVELAGWVDAATFRRVCRSGEWGHGVRYFVPADKLRPMHELLRVAGSELRVGDAVRVVGPPDNIWLGRIGTIAQCFEEGPFQYVVSVGVIHVPARAGDIAIMR